MKLLCQFWALLVLLGTCATPSACSAQKSAPVALVAVGQTASVRAEPAWLSSAIFYEIFPRAFSAKGDLAGITARLDELQKLRVNVLWIMPIHPIGKARKIGTYGSVYAVRDYLAINPDLGTDADLHHLVQAAHARHMRVILDEVPDHTAWDSVMMSHPEFYQHDASGKVVSPHGWNDVAALNYNDPGLRKYMTGVFLYWLKEFDIDGFRCDDAADVPTSFWEQTRTALEAVRPDVLMLAEASKPELLRHAFDIDYEWPLLDTLDDVLLRGRPASALREQIEKENQNFPAGAMHMLISDDHDTQRAMVRYGEKAAMAASALVFTLPGAPLLYNGMEVGDATPSAGPALFEELPIFWPSGQVRSQFPEFYRTVIPLRESSPAMLHGTLVWLHNSDEADVLTYMRQAPEETDFVAVNLRGTPFTGTVEATKGDWQEVPLPVPARITAQGARTAAPVPEQLSLPALSLRPFGVRIFRLRSGL